MKIFYEKPTRWLRDKKLVKVNWCCVSAENSFTIRGDLVYLSADSGRWNIKYCPFCGVKIEVETASSKLMLERKQALEEIAKAEKNNAEYKKKWGIST